MKRIMIVLVAILIIASFIVIPQPVQAEGGNWLDGWTYRREFRVNGTPTGAQTNYQLQLVVYFGAGVSEGAIVYTDNHPQNDFDDIRFTKADGTTLLDYWIEESWVGGAAIVWVEFDFIPAHPQAETFYMYYGNAAATAGSSIGDTFIVGDDFERGNDGDEVGDAPAGQTWTEYGGTVEISNGQAFSGTRSMKLVGAAAQPRIKTIVAHSDNIAIRWRQYKETAAEYTIFHGDGTKRVHILVEDGGAAPPEEITYQDDVGWNGTGQAVVPDTWDLLELSEFIWVDYTYDILWADTGSFPTVVGDDSGMDTAVATSNQMAFWGEANVGDDTWVDDVTVRNWTEIPPFYGSWDEEHRNIGIKTHYITGRGDDWVILTGDIADVEDGSSCTSRGFDYGLTTAMIHSWTEAGTWTAGTEFSNVFEDLQGTSSDYYYRSKVYDGTSWSYGEQKRFSLSPQQYVWHDTGDDAYCSYNATDSTWLAQTFTVPDIAFSVSRIDVKLLRIGNPGTITVAIREAGDGEPDTPDLATGTLADATIGDVDDGWYAFDLSSEVSLEYDQTYAIILRTTGAPPGADSIRWRWDSTGNLDEGNAIYSPDAGTTWTQYLAQDMMFRCWGNPVLEVNNGKAFSTYLENDDWLLVCQYLNEYPPYYDVDNASARFYIQLVDDDGVTVLAQTITPDWGFKPGSIYLSAATATPLEWEKEYRIRMYGNFSNNPYAEYPLFKDDWQGSDLTRLDTWCRIVAGLMGEYYGEDFTSFVAGKGIVLNDAGGIIFSTHIPGLDSIRPDLFEVTSGTQYTETGEYTQLLQRDLYWETLLGPYVTGALTSAGNVVGISGSTMGVLLTFLVYILVAILCFAPGHAIAAIVVPMPIIITIWGTGMAELVLMGVILAVAIMLLIWQFWLKGA